MTVLLGSFRFKIAFTRCWHILKTVKCVTVAKFELAFTRCRNNLKMAGNVTVKTRCKTLMPKKCTLTLRIDQSRLKSVSKCFVFIIFKCFHDAVSKMYWFEFRFQTLQFSNSAGKMSRFRANGPLRRCFHRFQNLPASCERRLMPISARSLCGDRPK